MRWKQFLTPVQSMDPAEARDTLARRGGAFTLLDVRQPEEYAAEHLPGATLIPLPELSTRLAELDPGRPTIVYCAIGGRSRIAAQMLAGKGWEQVYNLAGGIKAWEDEKAAGPEDVGLHLFSGAESAAETLVTAWALEEGLRTFYESMTGKVRSEAAARLFLQLAGIEVKHQERILAEYRKVSGRTVSREEFARTIVTPAMEGGMPTEEYLERYRPDMESPGEIVSLAMAIEAQALDLYERAAARAAAEARAVLSQIADEERAHLEQLGKLFRTPM
jgi:sulfur-carrier protein adenylyltransferase/sulfurtransferase